MRDEIQNQLTEIKDAVESIHCDLDAYVEEIIEVERYLNEARVGVSISIPIGDRILEFVWQKNGRSRFMLDGQPVQNLSRENKILMYKQLPELLGSIFDSLKNEFRRPNPRDSS